MTFPCTRCGLCCQKIAGVPELQAYDNGQGVCVHYSSNAGCTIYERRPAVCRVDEGYARWGAKVTLAQYYQANANVCNSMQQEAEMAEIYRVKL